MAKTFRTFTLAGACCAFFAFGPAMAGEFSVNPIRIDLGAAARSGVISVRNDGKDKLSFQLEGMEWTQDATGKDQYTETRDLIFFPKILTIEPDQEGVIRVGIKNPVVPAERTYRLFIEELPGAAGTPSAGASGAQINVLVRFGEPIFVSPVKPQDSLKIEGLSLVKGALTFSAKNSGNRHQIVQGIQLKGSDAAGKQVYALTLADRYLLAGTTKAYATTIAADQCVKIASLEVEVTTDKTSTTRKLDVARAMCP